MGDAEGPDPALIDPGGRAVETWREDYPYDELMTRDAYEAEKYLLQVELLKLQYWSQDNDIRHILLFEGRDAAGKGGTIKRFTEHLNPRAARVVALTKPTTTEQGQWYFQRYINHFPTSGEIVMFDRSWYNRAGVERVMGFCTDEQYEIFMKQAPEFERMIIDAGIHLTKFWFSVTQREQRTRFAIRQIDPVRRWKLSPMDVESPRPLGGLHLRQGGDVRAHRHRPRAVADHPVQRQEAGPPQRDARVPEPVRLRGPRRLGRARARPEHRRARPRHRRRLTVVGSGRRLTSDVGAAAAGSAQCHSQAAAEQADRAHRHQAAPTGTPRRPAADEQRPRGLTDRGR